MLETNVGASPYRASSCQHGHSWTLESGRLGRNERRSRVERGGRKKACDPKLSR